MSSDSEYESDMDQTIVDPSWQVAGNKKRRTLASSPIAVQQSEKKPRGENYVVFIKSTSRKNIAMSNPAKIREELSCKVGDVSSISSNKTNLIITCKTAKQRETLLKMKHLAGMDVTVSLPFRDERRQQFSGAAEKAVKFVLRGAPLDMSEAEVCNLTGAEKAMRLTRRVGSDQPSPTFSVLLTFKASQIVPTEVKFDYLTMKIETYIPRVIRCFKCQRFGHFANQCRNAHDVCPKCSQNHKYNDCNRTELKCINCGGNHSAAFQGCPKHQERKSILKHAAVNRVSYADALKATRGNTNPAHAEPLPTPPRARREEAAKPEPSSRSTTSIVAPSTTGADGSRPSTSQEAAAQTPRLMENEHNTNSGMLNQGNLISFLSNIFQLLSVNLDKKNFGNQVVAEARKFFNITDEELKACIPAEQPVVNP